MRRVRFHLLLKRMAQVVARHMKYLHRSENIQAPSTSFSRGLQDHQDLLIRCAQQLQACSKLPPEAAEPLRLMHHMRAGVFRALRVRLERDRSCKKAFTMSSGPSGVVCRERDRAFSVQKQVYIVPLDTCPDLISF